MIRYYLEVFGITFAVMLALVGWIVGAAALCSTGTVLGLILGGILFVFGLSGLLTALYVWMDS